MVYTLTIKELIKRHIIRNDKLHEFLNKMTDDEIRQFEIEIKQNLIEEGVVQKFPDWNAAFLARIIDKDILYNLQKISKI